MDTALTISRRADWAPIVALVLDGVTSKNSKRAYEKALVDFLTWYDAQGRPELRKAVVQAYRQELVNAGLAPKTVNLRLSAIRKLATEAADNGLLDPVLAAGVARVKGVRAAGRRSGNWLTREQAQALLDAPDPSTLRGKRDRALLAVLLGTGLRRDECARLEVSHVQQREGRWVILDLLGKGNKRRTVPLPSWAKAALDVWTEAAGISEGRLFRPVNKGDRARGAQLTPQAIRNVVNAYTGGELAPHDLRRTYARLAHRGGAALDQIQLSLGHASVQTTERSLGLDQDLHAAPCDVLGLRLELVQGQLTGL